MSVTITQTRDIAACRALRRTVFIDEQGVSEADEIDDQDAAAIHLLLTDHGTAPGTALGTARLLCYPGTVKIGRVCVLASARGQGHGAALIRAAIDTARALAPVKSVSLGAQTHATGFYAALGFSAHGPVFIDAGIDHQEMILIL